MFRDSEVRPPFAMHEQSDSERRCVGDHKINDVVEIFAQPNREAGLPGHIDYLSITVDVSVRG